MPNGTSDREFDFKAFLESDSPDTQPSPAPQAGFDFRAFFEDSQPQTFAQGSTILEDPSGAAQYAQDTFFATMGGAAKVVENVGYLAQRFGDSLPVVGDYIDTAERLNASLTGRQARPRDQVLNEELGPVREMGKESSDWWLDKISGDYEKSMQAQWGDDEFGVTTLVAGAAMSLPEMMLTMGAGGTAGKLAALATKVGTRRIAMAAASGSERAKRIMRYAKYAPAVAGAGAGGLTEGVMAAGASGVAVEEQILGMSHEELLAGGERYFDIYAAAEGMDEPARQAYAKQTLAEEAGRSTATLVGLSTAALGAPMGGLMGHLAGRGVSRLGAKGVVSKLDSTITGQAAVGAVGEGAQEFMQEGSQQFLQNLGIQGYADSSQGLGEGVLESAILGGLIGGIMGGAITPAVGGQARAKAKEELKAGGAKKPSVDPAVTPAAPGAAPSTPEAAPEPPPTVSRNPILEAKINDQVRSLVDANVSATEFKKVARWAGYDGMTGAGGGRSALEFSKALEELIDTGVAPENVQSAVGDDISPTGALTQKAYDKDKRNFEFAAELRIKPTPDQVDDTIMVLAENNATPYLLDDGTLAVPTSAAGVDGLKAVASSITRTTGLPVTMHKGVTNEDRQIAETQVTAEGAGAETEVAAAPAQASVLTPRLARVTDAVKGLPGVTVRSDATVVIESGPNAEAAIDAAASVTAATHPDSHYSEPTDAQKAAGNYAKAPLLLKGNAPGEDVRVKIENVPGSIRRSMPGQPKWSRKMKHHYGYVPGTRAADGDPVDVYLGRQAHDPALPVFVVRQLDAATGQFDEPKVVMGYAEEGAAKAAYLSEYPRAMHDKLFGGITRMDRAQFNAWTKSGQTDVPPDPLSKKPMASLRRAEVDPQTRTPQFRRWFGKSKVVDERGEPLQVYHGRLGDFDEFAVDSYEGAAFFTRSGEVAGQFAITNYEASGVEDADGNVEEGFEPNVAPVYLSINNPMIIEASEVMPEGVHKFDAMKAAIDRAKAAGHDGLHIKNVPEFDGMEAADQFAVFRPEQIKSSTGNVGTFDPASPNMMLSLARDDDFDEWFAGSFVAEGGQPKIVYRGQHGKGNKLQTKIGSISFGDRTTAETYATDPNDSRDTAEEPKVFAAYLSIKKPALVNEDDPFVDVSVVADLLDMDPAEVADRWGDYIVNTNNWDENFADKWGYDVSGAVKADASVSDDLYLMAYPVFDDVDVVAKLKAKGYDGVIHVGSGVNGGETEYRIFDESQVRIVDQTILASLSRRPPLSLVSDRTPLIGLPQRIKVDGRTVVFGPHKPARDAAKKYMQSAGMAYNPPREYARVQPERARRIAGEYHVMKHDPSNPEVQAAYNAMISETLAQWEAIKATGLQVEFYPPMGPDPYGNPRNAILDVVRNNHLYVFPTDEGFGSGDAVTPANAEKAAANLSLMTEDGIAEYNRTRNDGGSPNPEVTLHGWDEDSTGMLSRPAYTTNGELRWLRFADWEGRGVGLIVEDADGAEVSFAPFSAFDASDNPLLADSGEEWGGRKVLVNDIFRAVHDYFGHVKEGNGFRADGEENAWRSHAAMYSPLARRAMTVETRGQNSWVNFGPYGHKNRTASPEATVYADQKIGLLPLWVSEDGALGDGALPPRPARRVRTAKQQIDDAIEMANARLNGEAAKLLRRIDLIRDKSKPNIPSETIERATLRHQGGPMRLPEGDDGAPIDSSIQRDVIGFLGSYPSDGSMYSLRRNDGSQERSAARSASRNEAYPREADARRAGLARAGRSSRPGADSSAAGTGVPTFSQRKPKAGALSLQAVHYSTEEGLTKLDSRKAGSAAAAPALRRRMGAGTYGQDAPPGDLRRRLYFYEHDGEGLPEREDSVGGTIPYRVQLDNIYDLSNDPDDVVGTIIEAYGPAYAQNMDMIEEAINALGYDGMVAGSESPRPIVLFGLRKQVPVVRAEAPFLASLAPGGAVPQVKDYSDGLNLKYRITATPVDTNLPTVANAVRVALIVDGAEDLDSVTTILQYTGEPYSEFIERVDRQAEHIRKNLRIKNPYAFVDGPPAPKVNSPEDPAELFLIDGLYSAMYHALQHEKGVPKKATPKQWSQWFDGAQRRGLFRKEERDWVDIDGFLDTAAQRAKEVPATHYVTYDGSTTVDGSEIYRSANKNLAIEKRDDLARFHGNDRYGIKTVDNTKVQIGQLLDKIRESYPDIYETVLSDDNELDASDRADAIAEMANNYMDDWEWDGPAWWAEEVEPDFPWAAYDQHGNIVESFETEEEAEEWLEHPDNEDTSLEVKAVPSTWRLESNYESGEEFETDNEAQAAADELNVELRDEAYDQARDDYIDQLDDDEIIQFMRDDGREVPAASQYKNWAAPNAENYKELLWKQSDLDYDSPHFENESYGLLMHTRVSDRHVHGDHGPIQKVLFIEEHQSDFHQAAHEAGGMRTPAAEAEIDRQIIGLDAQLDEVTNELLDFVGNVDRASGVAYTIRLAVMRYGGNPESLANFVSAHKSIEVYLDRALGKENGAARLAEFKERLRALDDEINRLKRQKSELGDPAPFHKSWREVLMKNALRYAAQNGYDAVGWTSGFQQAERYRGGVSRAVDLIEWVPYREVTAESIEAIGYEIIERKTERPLKVDRYTDDSGNHFWVVEGEFVPMKNPPKAVDDIVLGHFGRDVDGNVFLKESGEPANDKATEAFNEAMKRAEARSDERAEFPPNITTTEYQAVITGPSIAEQRITGWNEDRASVEAEGRDYAAHMKARMMRDLGKSGKLIGYMKGDERFAYEFNKDLTSTDLINGEKRALKDVVGQEIASKIAGDIGETATFDARMVVGGEGQVLQYDKMFPKIVDKIVKPFGTRAVRSDKLGLPFNTDGGTEGWRVDITPELREFLARPMPAYSLAKGKRDADAKLVEMRKAIDLAASRLRGAPPYVVVSDEKGLPDFHQRQIASMGAVGQIEGFLDPTTGKVYFITNNIAVREGETRAVAIERVFAEEVLGHYGLRATFGKKAFDALRDQVYRDFQDDPRMHEIVDEYASSYGDPDRDRAAARLMADEFLAKSNPNDQPGLWSMLVAWVRDNLRRMGYVHKWTDNDIRNLMERVFDNVRTGMVPTSMKQLGAALVEFDGYDKAITIVKDGKGTRRTVYQNGQRHITAPGFTASIIEGAEANLPAAEITAFTGRAADLVRFLEEEGKHYAVMPAGLLTAKQLRGVQHQIINHALVIDVPRTGRRPEAVFSLRNRAVGSDDVEAILGKTVAPATSDMSMGQRFQQGFREMTGYFGAADTWLELKTGWIDSATSIEKLERDKFDGQLLDAAESAYKMISLTRNLPQLMAAVAKAGVPVYRDGTFVKQAGRKGMYEIFEPLWKTENGENLVYLWEGYAVARRSSQLINETNPDGTSKEKLLSQDEIDKLLELEQQYPVFRKVFDEWQTFNRQLLDLAVDRGAMSAETADLWKKNDYVPFFRVNEEEDVAAGITRKRGLSGQKVTSKRLTGSDRRIQPVMENIMMNSAAILEKVYQNEAMSRVVALADNVAMTKEPMRMEPVKLSNADIARQLVKAGLFVGDDSNNTPEQRRAGRLLRDNDIDFAIRAVERMTPEQKQQWSTFFRPARPEGADIVSVMVDGKPVYYRVHDPLVLRAIMDMTPVNFGGLINVMGGAKQLLTTMVTLDPGFMAANWMRDTLSSWAVVGEDFHPFKTAIGDAVSIWTEEGLVQDLGLAGGMTGGFYNPTQDFSDVMRRITKTEGTVLNTTRSLVDAYRKIGQESEQINRVAIARAVLARGGSLAEAAYQAQNVLNFSQHGDAVAAQLLIRTVPFLNARIQGLYRLWQGAKGLDGASASRARLGFFTKAAILAGISMLLSLKNADDERYEKLPEYQKDTYWHIFSGDHHFAIPKPFEVGVLAATIPERIMRRVAGLDSTKTTVKSVERALMDTFAFNPVPQAFKPIVEQWANRSFFTDRPIVGLAHEGLDPVAQYNPWTSETARGVSTMIDQVVPDPAQRFIPETFRSPIRLEHAVRAYLGTVGGYMLQMSDAALKAAGAYPEGPAMQDITDLPAIGSAMGRFYRGNPELETQSKYADELYDALDQADAAYRTVNAYMRQGELEKAREHTGEHLDELRVRAILHNFREEAASLNSLQRRIMDSKTMTPEQKREQLDQITRNKNRLMKKADPYLALMGY